MPDSLAIRTHDWLLTYAVPLWLTHGFDTRRGYFHESLAGDLTPADGPVRTMVQARQIYSFRVALDLDLCPMETAARAIDGGVRFMLDQCRNEDGSYALFVKPGLGITEPRPELYTQAFALFGLGNAFALSPLPEYQRRARDLVTYLRTTRAGSNGGFTELDAAGQIVYRSNPLMHLFEAAIYWAEIDPDEPTWTRLAADLADLGVRLIDPLTGLMPEYFDADWTPSREDGRFIWEPGHQFEWDWLFARFEVISGRSFAVVRDRLYQNGSTYGVRDGRAFDEGYSDWTIKRRSARFWPQAERAKAAVRRGDRDAAVEAIGALTQYLDVPRPGLWCDVIDEAGNADERPAKASSFYHIIGALAEYLGSVPVVPRGPQEVAEVRQRQRDN